MGRTRAPRPTTTHFDPAALAENWNHLAKIKTPGFQWDGSSYERGRGPNVDVLSLALHAAALLPLLLLGITGFPALADIRAALLLVNDSHGILVGPPRFIYKIATDAADKWRIMCAHVYQLKKSGATNTPIQELIDIIKLADGSSGTAEPNESGEPPDASTDVPMPVDSPSAEPLDTQAVETLFAHVNDQIDELMTADIGGEGQGGPEFEESGPEFEETRADTQHATAAIQDAITAATQDDISAAARVAAVARHRREDLLNRGVTPPAARDWGAVMAESHVAHESAWKVDDADKAGTRATVTANAGNNNGIQAIA